MKEGLRTSMSLGGKSQLSGIGQNLDGQALDAITQGMRSRRQSQTFRASQGLLDGGRVGLPFAEAAPKLGMDEGAVRVAVHRLRKRYRELLRDEIAQTLDDAKQVEEELRSLQAALAV